MDDTQPSWPVLLFMTPNVKFQYQKRYTFELNNGMVVGMRKAQMNPRFPCCHHQNYYEMA